MAFLKKIGPHKYRVRWRDGGRGSRNRTRTVSTFAAAKALKLEVEAAQELGRIWTPASAAPVPDLEEVFAGYIRDLDARGQYTKTLVTGLDRFMGHLRDGRPRAGLRVDELTRQALVDFIARLRAEQKSASTIAHYVGAVQRAWAWASISVNAFSVMPG